MSRDSIWAPDTADAALRRRLPARVRIVTDSSSDMLPSHAQAIGVLVVPNRLVLDGQVLRDGIDVTAAQFYARRPSARSTSTTEPASPADFVMAYQAAFAAGATGIVSIHVSSHLSQVVRHAVAARDYLTQLAARAQRAPRPIVVLDSLQLGIGMWPSVTEAARMANLGASVPEVQARVVSLLARTHAYVMVESLEALRRSGRIGRLQQLVGTVIDAHPILTLDQGEARLAATIRSRRRAVVRLCELALAAGAIETLLICGTSIEAIAEMEELLAARYLGTIRKTWLGPVNGTHLGPASAVAVVVRE
jgi:DegV family protein with EDD domain